MTDLLKILSDRYNLVIKKFTQKNKIVMIDLNKELVHQDNPAKYFVDHAHMTNEGYKLIAEIVYNNLISSKVIQ
jgi:lysophospholipase L1-like esterase